MHYTSSPNTRQVTLVVIRSAVTSSIFRRLPVVFVSINRRCLMSFPHVGIQECSRVGGSRVPDPKQGYCPRLEP